MKILNAVLRILILLPLFSILLWHFATPDQRAHHLPWVYQIAKFFSAGQPPEYFQLPIKYVYENSDRPQLQEGDDETTESKPSIGHGFVRYHCSKPETSDITLNEQLVYQWEDALGKSHMGDRPPIGEDVRNLRRVAFSSKQQFQLNIDDDWAILPAFAQDRFRAEILQIYEIMRKDWQLSDLRQTHLNLKLIDDFNQYQAYQANIAPGLGATSGFYSPKRNQAVIHTAGYAQRTYRVTRHEVTHAILAGLFGQLPTWFNEGVAEYFTGMQIAGQSKVVPIARHHLQTLEAARDAQRLPALRSYFDVSSEAWYQDVNKADRYAMGWAIVFFLLSHEEGKVFSRKFMQTLSDDFCKPIDSAAFFDAHYPGRLEGFQKQWQNWVFNESKQAHRY